MVSTSRCSADYKPPSSVQKEVYKKITNKGKGGEMSAEEKIRFMVFKLT